MPEFECEWCKKSFKRENTFLVHICERKRRWLNRDERYVKIGFMVYNRFYQINYNYNKNKTFIEFMDSKFYTSFTKFGKYIINNLIINPDRFIDFLIKTGVQMNKWDSPTVYEIYIRELNKKETPDVALERSFALMVQWGTEHGEEWYNFFRKINTNLATQWIQNGRISPWVFYNAESSSELLSRMSDEQINMVLPALDANFWNSKFKIRAEDTKEIKKELKKAGL